MKDVHSATSQAMVSRNYMLYVVARCFLQACRHRARHGEKLAEYSSRVTTISRWSHDLQVQSNFPVKLRLHSFPTTMVEHSQRMGAKRNTNVFSVQAVRLVPKSSSGPTIRRIRKCSITHTCTHTHAHFFKT